jgi:hypothetical protein
VPTKFYLHRTASEVQPTLPATNASASTTTPTWTPGVSNGQAATPLLFNRTMNTTIGTVAQTSLAYTTANNTLDQKQPFLRFVSPPLAAQTIAAQSISVQYGYSNSNTASFFQPTSFVGVWRPSTGALVGTLATVGQNVANAATTSQGFSNNNMTCAAVTCAAGDVIVVEIWRSASVQTMGTAYTNTIFYDGSGGDSSTTNISAYLNFANTLTLQTLPAEITFRAAVGTQANAGAFTLALPPGTTDGDFLVVWAESSSAVSSTGPLTAPAGWIKGTTFSPNGTSGFCCFYWAPYSAALSRAFMNNGSSSWCVGAYYKTGEVLDVDGAAVATYVTSNTTTVTIGQPTTTGAGRYEVVGISHPATGTLNTTATVSLDAAGTSGIPTSQSWLGHYLVHPLGASVTCPAHNFNFTANIANKTGAGLLLKAAPSISEPDNALAGPVDNFEA